jgi:hypothetical protein
MQLEPQPEREREREREAEGYKEKNNEKIEKIQMFSSVVLQFSVLDQT